MDNEEHKKHKRNKYVLFPLESEIVWKMYKTLIFNFWDIKTFYLVDQKEEKNLKYLYRVLKFFSKVDKINCIVSEIYNKVEAEAKFFLGHQSYIESFHVRVSSEIIEKSYDECGRQSASDTDQADREENGRIGLKRRRLFYEQKQLGSECCLDRLRDSFDKLAKYEDILGLFKMLHTFNLFCSFLTEFTLKTSGITVSSKLMYFFEKTLSDRKILQYFSQYMIVEINNAANVHDDGIQVLNNSSIEILVKIFEEIICNYLAPSLSNSNDQSSMVQSFYLDFRKNFQ